MLTITRRKPDGFNDNGKGLQCSKYCWYLGSGIMMNYAPHPDYGPCNGNQMVQYLIDKCGFVECGNEAGAIFSYNSGTVGHCGMCLGGEQVNDANWNSCKKVTTHAIAGLNSKPGIRFCKPKTTPPPAPAPQPPKPEPAPAPAPTGINVGDTVIVNGYGTADSYGGGAKTKSVSEHTMRVIRKIDGVPRPYGLNMWNDGAPNNSNDVTGWWPEDAVRKV